MKSDWGQYISNCVCKFQPRWPEKTLPIAIVLLWNGALGLIRSKSSSYNSKQAFIFLLYDQQTAIWQIFFPSMTINNFSLFKNTLKILNLLFRRIRWIFSKTTGLGYYVYELKVHKINMLWCLNILLHFLCDSFKIWMNEICSDI